MYVKVCDDKSEQCKKATFEKSWYERNIIKIHISLQRFYYLLRTYEEWVKDDSNRKG